MNLIAGQAKSDASLHIDEKLFALIDEAGDGLIVETHGQTDSEVGSSEPRTLKLARYCAARSREFISLSASADEVRFLNRLLADSSLPTCARVLKSTSDLPILAEVAMLCISGPQPADDAFAQFMLAPIRPGAKVFVECAVAETGFPYGTASEIVTYLTAHDYAFDLQGEAQSRNIVFRSPPIAKSFEVDSLEDYLRESLFSALAASSFSYPEGVFDGKGIVICAGGKRYFTNAWVCVNVLRMLGCSLPIEFWHLGEREMSDEMKELVRPLNVKCIDALAHPAASGMRRLNGWELKPFSIIHSNFSEVLYLDADNVPVKNPEFLFDCSQYRETGAVFWPDFGRLGPERLIWKICGNVYRDEPEFESGQIVVDKRRCWKALQLTMHLNEYSDFFYLHVHGDKETFHMAWRKLEQPYSMPSTPIRHLASCTMVQHDFDGKPLFQHRNMRKWTLDGDNPPVAEFLHEKECVGFLEVLRGLWSQYCDPITPAGIAAKSKVSGKQWLYVRIGYDFRLLEFLPSGRIGKGSAGMERSWQIVESDNMPVTLWISNEQDITCRLVEDELGCWRGNWERFEKMPICLIPVARK